MCGIAGAAGIRLDGTALKRVLDSMRHRGPDDEGVYRDGDVSLLHTRLSIIDLSEGGHQPMVDEETGVILVYNGEIFNYTDLRSEIGDGRFTSQSDTEVVLRLYLRDGIECVRKLRGMFAFAVWDPRDDTLHLARDRFGIKPLHYHLDGTELRFASEVKAVLASGVPARLDQKTTYDFLRYSFLANGTGTFFEGIRSLEPGHTLSFHRGDVRKTRYWNPFEGGFENDSRKDAEIEEEVWELLKENARRHMLSDVPVGVSLSSGLDSQFVAYTLGHLGYGNVHTFTYGFSESEYDEIPRVEKTDYGLDMVRHHRRTRPEDVLPTLESAVRAFELPLGGLGSLSNFRLMEKAHDEGLKVLLCGDGSDEIFGGYRYHHLNYFLDLADDPETLDHELACYNALYNESLTLDEARERTARVMAPDGSKMEGRGFVGKGLSHFRERTDGDGRAGFQTPVGLSHARQAMTRDVFKEKIPKLLWFHDRQAMAWSVEMRVPFLDHVVFERVMRLPPNWLVRNGVSKFLPKRLLQKFRGVDFLDRTKHFVAWPQREWLKGLLFEPIQHYLDTGVLADSGIVDYPAFRKAYADYAASPDLGNSFFVWKMLNLEAMLRTFFPETRV